MHDPVNREPIKEIWAFISQDEKGNEGIVAAELDGQSYPLIGSTRRLLELMRPLAVLSSRRTSKKILLIRMSHREDMEILNP